YATSARHWKIHEACSRYWRLSSISWSSREILHSPFKRVTWKTANISVFTRSNFTAHASTNARPSVSIIYITPPFTLNVSTPGEVNVTVLVPMCNIDGVFLEWRGGYMLSGVNRYPELRVIDLCMKSMRV
ncbi:hypothetical protein M405DRAFT_828168, partial [Rhizopogon salebrosus TDB-379]